MFKKLLHPTQYDSTATRNGFQNFGVAHILMKGNSEVLIYMDKTGHLFFGVFDRESETRNSK